MSQQLLALKKKKGYLKSTTLILVAFCTAYYARIFCSLTGAPSFLNFLHFVTVPFGVGVALVTTRCRDKKQLSIIRALLMGLLLLLGVMVASAVLNSAGVMNVVMHFLLLGEPFMLVLGLVCIPMSPAILARYRRWVIGSSFANLLLAFIQRPLIASGHLYAKGLDETDGMAGVFFGSNAGNYVSTTVSLYFSLYFLVSAKKVPLWLRLATLAAAFCQLQLSDAKQVLFAFFLGWVLLALSNFKDIKKSLMYLIAIVTAVSVFYWCMENLEAFAAFKNYADKDGIYGSDGAATLIKTAPFRIIPTYYHSPLNWLLGLGSGHTVGRLGGWLLPDYWNLLTMIDATMHPVSKVIWKELYNSWIAMESTMYSPFFGWAGIWGDLGFLGLGAYLYLSFLVWRYLCLDSVSKFLLLSVIGFGLIFTQMEEPGYMLYTAMIIGLRWHEIHSKFTV